MRKVLKLISAFVAVVLMLTMVSATASTNYEVMDDAIYIASASVPEDATAYALDMFSHLSAEFVASDLCFSLEEATELRVASGFCAEPYDNSVDASCFYYYPVMLGSEVVALITVADVDGSYIFKFCRDDMAISLNDVQTSLMNPLTIIVSDVAYYGKTNEETFVLSSTYDAEIDVIDEQLNQVPTREFASDSVVQISLNNVYDNQLMPSGESVTGSLMGDGLNVAVVDNWSYDDGERGTCWASCVASVVCYYLGYATSEASSLRYEILADRLSETGSYVGTVGTMASYIKSYVSGISLTTTSSMLSWAEVKSAITDNNAPFCTIWKRADGQSSHAMVVRGYFYSATEPDNSDYYIMTVMDPNVKFGYVQITYGKTYDFNSTYYTWTQAIIKN